MYLFDTDHVVISQQQTMPEFSYLLGHVRRRPPHEMFVSVVSFHEQIMGWTTYLSRGKKPADVVRGYDKLLGILTNFAVAQVLPFDDAAAAIFDDLRSQQVRIGTLDLRIAAIALARNMTVVTRNTVDFGQVPGLRIEDWTIP